MIGLILRFSTSSRRKSRSWRWIFAKQDGSTLIFTAMFQAHLPDADKPPLWLFNFTYRWWPESPE
jgi:hypothetical protein